MCVKLLFNKNLKSNHYLQLPTASLGVVLFRSSFDPLHTCSSRAQAGPAGPSQHQYWL